MKQAASAATTPGVKTANGYYYVPGTTLEHTHPNGPRYLFFCVGDKCMVIKDGPDWFITSDNLN